MTFSLSSHPQKTKPNSLWLVFFILFLLFCTGFYASLRLGALVYNHQEVMTVLVSPFEDSPIQDVLIDLRLPRMLAASLVGAAMAVAGALMQGLTRNPIADPGLLGIHAGAGLALIIAYAISPNLQYQHLLWICMAGSLLASCLVLGLSYQVNQNLQPFRLILAGAMISILFSAIGQALTLAFDLSTAVIGWQSGGLTQLNWQMIRMIAPFILLGLALAQSLAHQVTILNLHETVAKGLGQDTRIVSLFLIFVILLLSSAAVALVGVLSFIGLFIPHLMSSFTGRNYRLLLPFAGLAGATFLLWVDLLARTLQAPSEMPLSSLISLLGIPWFLWLMKKEEKQV